MDGTPLACGVLRDSTLVIVPELGVGIDHERNLGWERMHCFHKYINIVNIIHLKKKNLQVKLACFLSTNYVKLDKIITAHSQLSSQDCQGRLKEASVGYSKNLDVYPKMLCFFFCFFFKIKKPCSVALSEWLRMKR